MKEIYRPILETEKVSIYQKKDKYLIVSEKEFTLQTNKKILKRPMKEQEPKENKLPICGGCEQSININDPELVYLRHKGKNYHEDCLKLEEAKTFPKETIVFEDKGVSGLSFMKAMKENEERFTNTKKGSPWYYARKLYLRKKEERKNG